MFLRINQHSSCSGEKRCDFFFPCILVWTQINWVLAWWQSSINVSRCALQTRWAGMPCAAFPVFLNLTCACYTFVHRWQRAEITVAHAIMGAIFWFALETYSHTYMMSSIHCTNQCRCMIHHLPGIYSYPAVCLIRLMTLGATFIITGVGSTKRIRNTDVAVCLATDVQLHVLP